jgi:hypothetical protein
MNSGHVKDRLSQYCLGELEQAEARTVAEHILACEGCRQSYEEVKLGLEFLSQMKPVAPPVDLWPDIAARLDSASFGQTSRVFDWRIGLAAAAALILITLAGFWYGTPRKSGEIAQVHPSPSVSAEKPTPLPQVTPSPGPSPLEVTPRPVAPARGSLEVTSLAGAPLIASSAVIGQGRLGTGQLLETDGQSRAQITIADIGRVDVEPNSSISLIETRPTEHRLNLKRGRVHALIKAPPRIFVVETPAATAFDLGCEYMLEVDESGGSTLRVTGGYVSLERAGREAVVPAGAICFTRPRLGPGTPFFEDASASLRKGVDDFDLNRDRAGALRVILGEARRRDTLTLWNLLPQVSGSDRVLVYDKLIELFPPPEEVTRAGVLRLDRTMLEIYRKRLEWAW